jgi:SAM-dependent methyltransferase
MYKPEFRDEVYNKSDARLPWTSDGHIKCVVNWLNQHWFNEMKWKRVLDYWCGKGFIWENCLQKWAKVDFAEISNTMVDFLMKKYCCSSELWKTSDWEEPFWQVNVFKAGLPSDILVESWTYDYIFAWSVLHHINPDNWKNFLDWFSELLKSGWKLVVTWWDESDSVLKQDWFKWRFTWQSTYSMNKLPDYLDREKYEIEETWVYSESFEAFNIPRIFRYFILKKKNERKNDVIMWW